MSAINLPVVYGTPIESVQYKVQALPQSIRVLPYVLLYPPPAVLSNSSNSFPAPHRYV